MATSSVGAMSSIQKAACAPRRVVLLQQRRKLNVVSNAGKAGNWFPGSSTGRLSPDYLDGSIPGDYGFDPLGLGASPKNLQRFREDELIHARWAMLGALGCILPDALGYGNWLEAPNWAIKDGSGVPSYFGADVPFFGFANIVGFQVVLMTIVEAFRNEESDPEKRLYPGGSFDPLGLAKDLDEEKLFALRTREIKNGRLAMFAMAGFFAQGLATGNGPLADFNNHVQAPWTVNIATNGVSVPIY